MDPEERLRREALLKEIETRLEKDGAHAARRGPNRARQFMPFAALKGYEGLLRERERVPAERRSLTDEEALELSRKARNLAKGDRIRLVRYANGRYETHEGLVEQIDEARRFIALSKEASPNRVRIPFDDVFLIESLT